MNRHGLAILLLSFLAPALNATSITVGGTISADTVWSADTVLVTDTVKVDSGATLTIAPGTKVMFHGTYRIKVMGRLLAVGTAQDSILFTATDTTANYTGGWTGIRFQNVSPLSDTSKLAYCRIQYARSYGTGFEGYGGAVFINSFGKVIVENSTINNNIAINGGAGICVWLGSGIIRNNTIRNNATTAATFSFGAGIFCQSSSPLIYGNTIRNNNSSREGGGISCQGSSPRIINNLILNNTAGNEGGGIRCNEGASPVIIGCLIRGNTASDGGGAFANASSLTFYNSTVVNNRASIGPGLKLESSGATVRNSIIWNNGISTSSGNVSSQYSCLTGYAGTGNINIYPQFVDSAAGNFQLAAGSPCINGGGPDTAGLELPEFDLAGHTRIAGWRIDMGAYEDPSSTVIQSRAVSVPKELAFSSILPNPFNRNLAISFITPARGRVSLVIYDLLGREMASPVKGILTAGLHEARFDGKDLPAGVYVCRLAAEGRAITNIIIRMP